MDWTLFSEQLKETSQAQVTPNPTLTSANSNGIDKSTSNNEDTCIEFFENLLAHVDDNVLVSLLD